MVEHFADLGWEKRKIQTLADLKREIERLGDINERILPIQTVIETINSFEAGLRKRIKELQSELTVYRRTNCYRLEELRAILGDRDD